MTARVHVFDAHEGGTYRMSLTYKDPTQSPGGKTSEDTDTFQGRFVELVARREDRRSDRVRRRATPAFAGEMKMTTRLADADGGTEVTILCQGLPAGIRPEDNEDGHPAIPAEAGCPSREGLGSSMPEELRCAS